MSRQISRVVSVVEEGGKAVVVELVLRTLDTEPCPRCGNPVVQGEKFCSVCVFNMME